MHIHSLCETLTDFLAICFFMYVQSWFKKRFSPCLDVDYRMYLAQVSKVPEGGTSIYFFFFLWFWKISTIFFFCLLLFSQLPLIWCHPRTWLHMQRDVVPDEDHGWHRRMARLFFCFHFLFVFNPGRKHTGICFILSSSVKCLGNHAGIPHLITEA